MLSETPSTSVLFVGKQLWFWRDCTDYPLLVNAIVINSVQSLTHVMINRHNEIGEI